MSHTMILREGDWAKIKTSDSLHKKSNWFDVGEVDCGSYMLAMKTDGVISEESKRFEHGFHWCGKDIR